ncbi:MAG: 4Fe-4S cluster-binding domain-containing protein [Clostridia bacterium]|nr:4Fe-4S cluster-binding domain-containing protein [Clostridia bacterium]
MQDQEFIEKKRSLTLIVTERCDLSCVYCYEHNKSAKQMTFEEAKKIIDRELVHLDEYQYTIEFFGGEPFLNFELIKQVVEYVLSTYYGHYCFFATTNGTQVHGEIQEWLKKYRYAFTLGLSLDGNKIAHDLNRCNSFDKIDLDFFLEQYPEQTVKMTISEQSLPYLAESIQFLTEKGFPISCNLAYMIDWLAPKNAEVLEEELEKIIEYYLEHPKAPKCNMFDFPLAILAHPYKKQDKLRKYCGCGTHMRCYDMDGECYPCQLFSPLSAGEKAWKSKDFQISDQLDKENFPEACKTCYYQRICQFCLGSNYLSTGNIYHIDEARCRLYKLIFKANAKLKALEWERGLVSTDDEQGLLQSIVRIAELEN